jgi:hypothetical protein
LFFFARGIYRESTPNSLWLSARRSHDLTLALGPHDLTLAGHQVRDSLQYVDFAPPPSWPPWTQYVYRPGVALRDCGFSDEGKRSGSGGGEDAEDGEARGSGGGGGARGLRSVLVAQVYVL